jgi:hypothetical protein
VSDAEPELPGSVFLRHEGQEVAEAWGEQEGEVVTMVFRVPRDRWEADAAGPRVTIDLLLKLAAVSHDEVESWRFGDDQSPDATHVTVRVRLKPPAPETARDEGQDIPPETWQALEAIWKGILGLEASIESSRMSMEGLRSEMEGAFRKSLNVEEKVHALQSDVAQWDKAKNRVHYALPKVKEFIHRATFALAAAERKALDEVYRNHIEPRVPLPDVDRVREQLEHFQKSRQVLFAQGNSVSQECRAIMGEISRALGTLQRNAADRARQKRSEKREKGKHF